MVNYTICLSLNQNTTLLNKVELQQQISCIASKYLYTYITRQNKNCILAICDAIGKMLILQGTCMPTSIHAFFVINMAYWIGQTLNLPSNRRIKMLYLNHAESIEFVCTEHRFPYQADTAAYLYIQHIWTDDHFNESFYSWRGSGSSFFFVYQYIFWGLKDTTYSSSCVLSYWCTHIPFTFPL